MAVGRNDPCPCGSGKKYKRCCGAVVAINPGSAAHGARQCGTLTAGCDPDEALLAWMREFSLKTDRPFFYERSGERFGFGPRDFQMEMLAKLDRGERLW